jgi:excisionase family DNA binding protein
VLPRSSRSGLECFKRVSREPFLPRGTPYGPATQSWWCAQTSTVSAQLRFLTTAWRRADENRFSSAQLLNRVTSTDSKTFCLNFGMSKFCSKLSGKFAAVLPRALLPHTPGVSLKFPLVLGHGLCSSPAPAGLRPYAATRPLMTTSNVDIQNLVTVQQAAQLLNITPAAIHKAIKRGRLPYLKLGRVFVIQRTDLIQYRKTRSVGGRPKKARP